MDQGEIPNDYIRFLEDRAGNCFAMANRLDREARQLREEGKSHMEACKRIKQALTMDVIGGK